MKIKSLIQHLFERSPTLEIAAKLIYWRIAPKLPWMAARLEQIKQVKATAAGGGSGKSDGATASVDFSQVLERLRSCGVREGDILIVHASMSELSATGLTAPQIIEGLRSLVGETGTLAMPAFPILRGQPAGQDLFDDKSYEGVLTYDVKRAPPWTGALAKTLMKMNGAVRSRHPANSMAALGPHAADMMRDNIALPESTPCGPASSWNYCYRHDAKIVALGVDLAHSLTMIHVAEDSFEAEWPVRNWYRRRSFKVVDGDFEQLVQIRERRHAWSILYAERSFSRDMRVAGVSRDLSVGPLEVTLCGSRTLIEFLRTRQRIAYPYKVPFLSLQNWLRK